MTTIGLKTCNVPYGDSSSNKAYYTYSGAKTQLTQQKKKGQSVAYAVPKATAGTFTLSNDGTDGWCVDHILYDGKSINLAECGGKIWLDNPCDVWGSGDGACLRSVEIDPVALKPTNCPVKIEFGTCNVKDSASNGAFFAVVPGYANVKMDNVGTDRKKSGTDTYYIPHPTSTFQITTPSTDGWCVDHIKLNGKSVSLSSCTSGRAWIRKTCSGKYDGKCVGSALQISATSMKVTNC
jgi:hypothetical protein